jgi:hypothetical protein
LLLLLSKCIFTDRLTLPASTLKRNRIEFSMRNHQCSCGCGEPYRNSPSAFPSALSTTILRFPQVFSGFSRFCSYLGTFFGKKLSKIAISTTSRPSSHAHFAAALRMKYFPEHP